MLPSPYPVPQFAKPAQRSLLEDLSAATQSRHRELEQRLNFPRPDVDVAAYADLLEGFYGFYVRWEPGIASELRRAGPDFARGRSKIELLADDLTRLGRDPERVPVCHRMPDLGKAARVWGSLYVMEGSTLGGQVIVRQLCQNPATATLPMSFFAGYGERTGARWREFHHALEAHPGLHPRSECLDAAVETFRTLGDWLLRERRGLLDAAARP